MKKRGKGVAGMIYAIGSTGKANPSTAIVRVNHDGKSFVYIGAADVGQGVITAMCQIAAETLGLAVDDITMVYHDTEFTPYDYGTGASRVTLIMGNAVKNAAENAKTILLEAAARILNVNQDFLTIRDGKIFLADLPARWVSIAEAAFFSERVLGKPVYGLGSFSPDTSDIDKETGQGRPYSTYVFATQVAEVEVDTATGEVTVLKVTAVHDCGRVINPILAEGQVTGGIAMGIGHALMEEMLLDGETGAVLNDSFTDYLVPTALDVPEEINICFVETEDDFTPYGAKGIGEPANLPTAPAIINAIYDAVGVWITELPATPEKVLLALRQKTERENGGSAC
ncbi:MAG TPA: molybdopterin-dependent oxidoreductase [Clostridia bacterium]|nr:molybdopterin-dependent oxidoreductase [Clostridia bacterium]